MGVSEVRRWVGGDEVEVAERRLLSGMSGRIGGMGMAGVMVGRLFERE